MMRILSLTLTLLFINRAVCQDFIGVTDTTIDFSNAQYFITQVSNDLDSSFDDIAADYKTTLIDTSLLEVIADTDLVGDLEAMRDMIKQRMDEAERAASNIRYTAESSNTVAYNQNILQDTLCDTIKEQVMQSGSSYYVSDEEYTIETTEDTPNIFSTNNPIKTNLSQVILPLDEYHCSREHKMDIYWSRVLDPVFLENYAEMPTVGYQYYASQSGMTRLFPFTNFSFPLIYDARLLPFYTQSSSLPKMVVIALDSSGSVNGDVTQLMENTLDTILDFLTDSDLLAVFFFKNDYVLLLPSAAELNQRCPEQEQVWFVPATFENKQAFKSAVYLHDNFNSTANFDYVFNQAGIIYSNIDTSLYCTKLLILISDGGKGAATEAGGSLSRLLETNPDLHLATFLIGADVYDTKNDDMPVLSCAANGFFYRVGYSASVRYTVTGLVRFLTRPVTISQFKLSTWSNLHMQPWVSDYSPVISVTFPAYNSTDESLKPLMGVAGVDLEPLKFLQEQETWSFEHGDILLINNKGTVVFSDSIGLVFDLFVRNSDMLQIPEIYLQEFFRDYPDALTDVDKLSEMVVLDDSSESYTMDTEFVDLPGIQYVRPVSEVRYTWHTIESSEGTQNFRLLQRFLVSSQEQNYRFKAQLQTTLDAALETVKSNAIKLLNLDFTSDPHNGTDHDFVGIAFSSEIYCPGINYGTNRFDTVQIKAFIASLLTDPLFPLIPGCMENSAYWHLIYDMHFVYKYIEDGGDWINTEIGKASFIKLRSGLIIYRQAIVPLLTLGLNTLWDNLRNNRAPINTATTFFYDRQAKAQMRIALNYPQEETIATNCYRSENTFWTIIIPTYLFPIIITRPLVHTHTAPDGSTVDISLGVAGFVQTQTQMETYIQESFPDCFQRDFWCYFLDEGGFILFNSPGFKLVEDLQTTYVVGVNLYTKDPCLMSQLVKDGVFKKFETHTEICTCDADQVLYGSGSATLASMLRFVLSTLSALFNILHFMSLTFIKALLHEGIQLVLFPGLTEQLELGFSEVQLCERKTIKYAFGDELETTGNQTTCESCQCSSSKPYFAKRIENSNLLLVSKWREEATICDSCTLSEKRVSIIDETQEFEDTLRISLTDNNRPVKEHKVNTCTYRKRARKDQTRGCEPTWREQAEVFTTCDLADGVLRCNLVILILTLSLSLAHYLTGHA